MTEQPALRVAPPPFLADPALRAVLAALPDARIVGGAVRDALLGREVADVDLATPRPPEHVVAALRAAGLKAAPTGLDHGTVTAISDHRGFEVTTLRRDVETDGRHAVVAYTDDFSADAARRDFTINAMSMTPDGAVFDYFSGISDLFAGRVRFVGDAATRIAEDYLRILRFFRFHARYGRGAPDAEAIAAIRAAVPGLKKLSAERVWHELKRILAAPNPLDAIREMEKTGVLRAVLPELPEGVALPRLAPLLQRGAPPDPLLRLSALLLGGDLRMAESRRGEDLPIAKRLRMSKSESRYLFGLLTARAPESSSNDTDLKRALLDVRPEVLIGRVWLASGDRHLLDRLEKIEVPVFPLSGDDIRNEGVPQGPAVGEMLGALRESWLAGGCVATEAEMRAELARRLGR